MELEPSVPSAGFCRESYISEVKSCKNLAFNLAGMDPFFVILSQFQHPNECKIIV